MFFVTPHPRDTRRKRLRRAGTYYVTLRHTPSHSDPLSRTRSHSDAFGRGVFVFAPSHSLSISLPSHALLHPFFINAKKNYWNKEHTTRKTNAAAHGLAAHQPHSPHIRHTLQTPRYLSGHLDTSPHTRHHLRTLRYLFGHASTQQNLS
jgi:hypothetical protein